MEELEGPGVDEVVVVEELEGPGVDEVVVLEQLEGPEVEGVVVVEEPNGAGVVVEEPEAVVEFGVAAITVIKEYQ